MTPIIPGDLPGLPEAWREFYGDVRGAVPVACLPTEYDLRIPADRCLVAFWMARVLGVEVGVTVPEFAWRWTTIKDVERSRWTGHEWDMGWHTFADTDVLGGLHVVPSLSLIPLSSHDRDALAMAAVAVWLGEELRAGRITPSPAVANKEQP